MKKLLFAAFGSIALLALSPSLEAQTTIAGWNFNNDTVATNNSPGASTNAIVSGTLSADSIGMNIYATPNIGVTQDDIVLGKTSDTGANTLADVTNVWRIRGQAGSNGAANGWSSAAPIGTQGAQFFASTSGYTSSSYNTIQVAFDWYTTTQGEANLQLEYTTNGGTNWTNIPITLTLADTAAQVLTNDGSDPNTVTGSYVNDNALNNASAGQDWFTGLTATITDPNALNDSGFGIEMVNASTGADCISAAGTALNNNSGNWRFDNVSISAAQAVPEPRTWAAMLSGLAALLVYHSRRRRNRGAVNG